VLLIWTGNFELAEWSKTSLVFYNLGYSSAALINTFTLYFFATGRLKFISIVNSIWALVTVFLFVVASIYQSVLYAGFFWFLTNIFLLTAIWLRFYKITYNQIKWNKIFINFFKVTIIGLFFYFFNYFFKESLIFYNRILLFFLVFVMYFFFIFSCLYFLNFFDKLLNFVKQMFFK